MLPRLRRMEKRKNARPGVYFIFKSMEQGPTFRISLPKYPAKDPHYRIVAHQRSRFTHYYFYVRDAALGPMVVRVASFFPFQTAYYLTDGHSFIEQELKRAGIGFRKHDNAFLAVDDVAALQAAADRLSSTEITRRLLDDLQNLILGPKFSKKERAKLNLSRFYAVSQIEYCRNFIFRRHFPSTSYSSAAANSACGGSALTRSPRSSASGSVAGCTASWPRSSTRSSTAIRSSAPTSRAASSNSTTNQWRFYATNP